MSTHGLSEFRKRLEQDESLRQELSRALSGVSAGDPSADEVVAFARARGYEFTAEDLVELTDESLDGVAGGLMSACAKGEHVKSATITSS